MDLSQFAMLVVVPLALAACLPLLGDAYERRFWATFGGVAIAIVGGAWVWPKPSDPFAPSPWAVGLLLVLLPVLCGFLVCTWSPVNERPLARAIAGPVAYFVGVLLGITIGVNLGAFAH